MFLLCPCLCDRCIVVCSPCIVYNDAMINYCMGGIGREMRACTLRSLSAVMHSYTVPDALPVKFLMLVAFACCTQGNDIAVHGPYSPQPLPGIEDISAHKFYFCQTNFPCSSKVNGSHEKLLIPPHIVCKRASTSVYLPHNRCVAFVLHKRSLCLASVRGVSCCLRASR